MKTQKLFNFIIFSITLLIFYIPIFLIVFYSFNISKATSWEGFSIKWYIELFTNSARLWDALKMSFLIGIGSALMSTFLGGCGAWAIWHKNNKLRTFLLTLSYLPLMLPDLIIGISLLTLFVVMALPLGLGSIFIAHTTMNIPFALLLILSVLEDSDLSVIEAAKDLGANELQIWLKVILPIIYPGLIASFLLTLTLSLDDFAITFFVSGPGSTTLPLYMFSAIRFGLSPTINALSTLIIGGSIILFTLNKHYMKIAFK
ncbi:MAG: ABC transporter permease [Spirochaetota bacterium]|nr:ABC transporter permease [Spirochaetota bacterium]